MSSKLQTIQMSEHMSDEMIQSRYNKQKNKKSTPAVLMQSQTATYLDLRIAPHRHRPATECLVSATSRALTRANEDNGDGLMNGDGDG